MVHDSHRLTRYEKIILADRSLPREVASLLCGASRGTRLSRCALTPHERTVTEVASGFLAPLTFLYAAWVLCQARGRGIRRLCFLARDGLVIMEAAEIIARHWGMEMELRYLHTSREAWLFPSLRKMDDFAYSWITWGYLGSISVKEIEKRLQFHPGDLWRRLAALPGFLPGAPDAPLDANQLRMVRQLLATFDVFSGIRQRSDVLLENVRGYLAGEGLFDGTPYALVDTGWKGTSQYAFSLILDKLGSRPRSGVIAFYLGLNRGHHLFAGDMAISFLFDWNRSGIDYRLYNFLCFELLLSAREGRTAGYRDAAGGYAPILIDNPSPDNLWAVDIHHECVRSYVRYVAPLISPDDLDNNGSSLCQRLAAAFISRPTSEEASVYGDLTIAGEMGERDMQRLAPPVDYRELALIALKKRKIQGFWPQGSIARSNMKGAGLAYRCFLDLKLLDVVRKFFLKY